MTPATATRAKQTDPETDPDIQPIDPTGIPEDPETPIPDETEPEDDDHAQEYERPEPTAEEIKSAMDVLQELRARAQDYGPVRTIEALIQVVDVVPAFTCPMEWQGAEDEEYRDAPIIGEIAALLLRGCPSTLEISPQDVVCLWRNKEKWVDGAGNNVRAKSSTFTTRVRYLTEDTRASIEINFHLFKTMNPRQKVFTVYSVLRQLDGEGKKNAPDFSGFLDELELFGLGTFRDHVRLAYSVQQGLETELPHQLSLLEAAAD